MPGAFSETLLEDLRAESVNNVLVELSQNGGARYLASRNAVIHIVLRGKAFLISPTSAHVQSLGVGDSILALYGDAHSIVGAIGNSTVDVVFDERHDILDELAVIRAGDDGETTLILSCSMELAYLSPSARINRAVPDLWVLQPHSPRASEDCALRFDPGQIESCCVSPGATAFTTMIANLYLVHMFRVARRRVWADRPIQLRSPVTRRISTAVQKMNAYRSKNWTVDNIAHEVGMSRSTFAKAFLEYVGATPLAYLTDQRMKHAASLLSVGEISLREVAHRVGYDVEDSFSRAFKRHYHVTPSEYRKMKRENNLLERSVNWLPGRKV